MQGSIVENGLRITTAAVLYVFFLVERFELVLFILSADGDVKLRIREKITELWRGFTSGPAGDGRFFDGQIVCEALLSLETVYSPEPQGEVGWKKSRSSLGPVLLAGSSLPEWPLLQAPSGRDHQ